MQQQKGMLLHCGSTHRKNGLACARMWAFIDVSITAPGESVAATAGSTVAVEWQINTKEPLEGKIILGLYSNVSAMS